MADGNSLADASSSKASDVHGETTVQINIKTLDSSVFTFRVDRKMSVLSLKETIAGAVGVPFGQQRLIFKGKVLKDDHFLSDYHIEDGDTLHLVARQPVQSQPTNSTSSEDARSSGNGPVGSLPRPRIGHSVVLGLNVSDQGENTSVDISRIIGSVLNTLGVGNVVNSWAPGNPSSMLTGSQTLSAGAQTVFGNSQTGIPSVPIPSPGTFLRQMVIPDSLTTLSAFITRMEQVLSVHSGYQSSAPSNDRRPAQLDTSSSLQYPSPDTLVTLLERAHELLSGPAAAALSHLSGRLDRDRDSVELAIRGQIQAEAMHVGVTMQQLGSLFLELGRTISTLRMGSSPAESMVNAGPAVYVSASGPNPIMVQPVPTQNSTLFAIPFPPIINVAVPEGADTGDAHHNINIHVSGISASTAGIFGSRANTGEGPREQLSAQNSAVNLSHGHSSQSAGNRDEENAIPPQVVPHSDIAGQEPESTNCNQYQEIGGASDLESCHRTSQMEKTQDKSAGSSESTIVISSKSLGSSQSEHSGHVPLGLGLGGLQPKRRIKQSHSEGNSTAAQQESTSNEHQQLITKGQELLESLVSQSLKIQSDKREKLTSPASISCAASVPGSRKSQVGQAEPPNFGGILQQMMPVVSQAFGIGSSHMSTSNPGESGNQPSENGNNMQVDLRLVIEGMEQQDLRGDVFCRILQAAGRLHEDSHTEILDAIGNDEELRKEFKEMMRRHLNLRLQRESRQNDKA